MDFVELLNLPLSANVIDIGSGYRYSVDALLDKSFKNIYVMDISAKAIERAKQRLSERAFKDKGLYLLPYLFQPLYF